MLKRIAVLGLCLTTPLSAYSKEQACLDFLNFNNNPKSAKMDFIKNPKETAWQWFVCLNQPIAKTSERKWEGLKPTSEVYLANGQKPSAFRQRTSPPQAVIKQAKALGMDTKKLFHNLDSMLQVDGLALEMGGNSPKTKHVQFVRYELLMSKGTFDYIVTQKVYNVNGQAALTTDLAFPHNAWELKTSWLWVGDDKAFLAVLEDDGYYIVNSYYRDDSGSYQVGYSALSGMHVINKLLPDWTWATFENVNNSKYTITDHIPPTPMTNQTGPDANTQKINATYQNKYPNLAAYELIGVQFNFDKNPDLLASSQMESEFQSRSSCIACHFTAAYSATDGYYNFAHKVNEGILYPINKTPESAFKHYKKLDFVWSLKRASWER